MNIALERDRLKLTNYLLISCGILIIIFSIKAFFDDKDKWGIRNSFQLINFKEYYVFLAITLFMISLPYLMFNKIATDINIENLPQTKREIAKLQIASVHGLIGYTIALFAFLGYTFIPFLITFIVSYFLL